MKLDTFWDGPIQIYIYIVYSADTKGWFYSFMSVFKRFGSVFRVLYRRVLSKINYDKYLQHLGVNFTKGTVHVYGHVDWQTEPWIITLGRNVYITDGVKFITHDGSTLIFRQYTPDLEITKPIVVGNDVFIGNNVIVLPGVTIGDNVVIGAGAVVSRDIPSNSLAVGVPARRIKSVDEFYGKLKEQSLHLGHLKGKEKDRALRAYYHYNK